MIGKLRDRISIVEVTSKPDTIGGQIPIRTIVAEIWCKVTQMTGTRADEFRAEYNKQPITMLIRTNSYPITSNNMIIYNGKDCVIHSIVTDAMNKITTLVVWAKN